MSNVTQNNTENNKIIDPKQVAEAFVKKAVQTADVVTATTASAFNKNSTPAVRSALLDTYKTQGYDAYKEQYNKFYSTTPVVYDNDLGPARELDNARYNVTRITDQSAVNEIQQANANGTLEVRLLDQDSVRNAYDTVYGTRNIGRDKLRGLTDADTYVLYDSSTGRYYRCANEYDEDYVATKEQYDKIKAAYELYVGDLEKGQKYYESVLRTSSGAAYQQTMRNYEEFYNSHVVDINALATKMNELEQYIMPNEAYRAAVEQSLASYEAAKEEIERYNRVIANYDDPYAHNSIVDVLKTAIFNIGDEDYWETLGDATAEWWGYLWRPLFDDSVEMSAGQRALVFGTNVLGNLGETLDIVGVNVKALVNADSKGMTPTEALASVYGLYGDGGYYNWDYDTGNLATDMFLEIISDPVNWFTFGAKSLATTSFKNAAKETLQVTVKELGLDVSDGLLEKLARRGIKYAVRNTDKPARELFIDFFTRELSITDAHAQIAKLGNNTLNFKEADRLAKILIKTGNLSGDALQNSPSLQKYLRHTNLAPADIARVVEISNNAYIKNYARITQNVDFMTQLKAFRVVDAARAAESFDTKFTKIAMDLTIPGLAPAKLLIRTGKALKNSGLPDYVSNHVLNIFKKVDNSARVADNMLAGEAAMCEVTDEFRLIESYVKTLNIDNADEVLRNLKSVETKYYTNYYNQLVTNLLNEFDAALKPRISAHVAQSGSLGNAAQVMKVFDEVAAQLTGNTFKYTEMFAFILNSSEFAIYLNSANKARLSKLELFRKNAYLRATAGEANAMFVKVNEAFDNLARDVYSFNKTGANYDTTLNMSQNLYTLNDIVNNATTNKEALTKALKELNTAFDNVKDISLNGRNTLVPEALLNTLYKRLEGLYGEINTSYGNVLNPAKVNRAQEYVDTYLDTATAAAVGKPSTTDILTKLFNEHMPKGKHITAEELADVLVTELDKAHLNADVDYAVIDANKLIKKEVVLSNADIMPVFIDAVSDDTVLGRVINNAAMHSDYYDVVKGTAIMHTMGLEAEFRTDLATRFAGSKLVALKDTLADDGLRACNNIIANTDFTRNDSVQSAVNRITDKLVEDTQTYMQGITPVERNINMFYNTLEDGTHVTFNSSSTAANVQAMYDHSSDFLSRAIDSTADESARDILFSVTHISERGEPIQVSLLDVQTNTRRTFTLNFKEALLDIADSTAYKMHGVDASKFKEDYLAGDVGDVFDNVVDYYDSINAFLNQIAAHTNGQRIRYVGFNSGVVHGGQANALKTVFNRYGMISGQFVDLADELRKLDFANTYLTDDEIFSLSKAVENHVNKIGEVVTSTENSMVGFGVEPVDLTSASVQNIARDLIKFAEDPAHQTDIVAPYIISSAITADEVAELAAQAHRLDNACADICVAIGTQGVLDDTATLINMQALKQLYESKTSSKLNIMNLLREHTGDTLNLHYTVRKDMLRRWMKSDLVDRATALELTEYHNTYKVLMGFESRIKDIHIADMLNKAELMDLYKEMMHNVPVYAQYDSLFTHLAEIDFDKLNNAQMLAVLFGVRKYAKPLEVSETVADTLEREIVTNHTAFLSGGFSAVNIADLSVYSRTAMMYKAVSDVNSYAHTLENAVDDISSLEAYFKMFDKTLGRSRDGMEYTLLHEILKDVYNVQQEIWTVRDSLNDIARAMYDSNFLDYTGEYYDYRGAYKALVERLTAHNDEVLHNALRNVHSLSDEDLLNHIIANCSGTMLVQLDGDLFKNYVHIIEDLRVRASNIDGLETRFKTINYNGADHPVLVLTAGSEFDGKQLRDALYAMSNVAPQYTDSMFKSVVNNMPNSMKLSDYTPANAAATTRVLEFAGMSKQEASRLVELMQRYDVFDVGFNCNVLGDSAFVKQFYPYKSDDLLRTLQQTVTHSISKLGPVTYYKALLNGNFFNISRFIHKSTSYEEFAKYVKTFHYTLCTLDEYGRPVAVNLTRDLYNTALKHVTNIKCMPTEFFKEASAAFQDITDANKFSRRSGLSYVAGYVTQAMAQLSTARKQGWLFTHISTPINNAISGLLTAVSDAGVGVLFRLPSVISEMNTFKRIYAAMLEQHPNITDEEIRLFFSTSPLKDMMPEKTFRNYLTVALMNGSLTDAEFTKMLSTQAPKLVNESIKLHNLVLTEAQTAEFTDYVQSICKDLNKAYNKHYDKVRNIYDYPAIQKELDKFFDTQTSTWAPYTQAVAMRYLAERKPPFDITNIPVLGRWYKFNQTMFSTVEEYIRTTLALHFMDNGYSATDAVARMLKTQFDYGDSGKFMKLLNTISPFSTYKLMNLKYWLFDSQTRGHATRLLADLGQYQGIVDPMELAGSIYWSNYYSQQGDAEEMDEYGTAIDQITSGSAANQLYVSTGGKILLPGNHYLKNAAPTFEALELYTSVLLAFTDYDAFKELISDNVYSPINTLSEVLDHLHKGGTLDAQYYADNYYAINDLVPVYGMLVNSIIAKIKAGNLNFSPAELNALYASGKSNAEIILELGLDGLATVWTSMIGTHKTQKPIGYNWNEQSDEYKATHRFVYGVSAVPTVFTKNPATYVDHMGMFVKLGFTKDEAMDLLQKGWYFDTDGNVHQYSTYTDEEMPNKFKYDAEVFDSTLRYLLERGYDIDAAYTYMKSFGQWVDETGTVRNLDDVETLWKESAEARAYYMLPAYVRNMPNQYSDQLAYYKSLGYSSEQAKYFMHQNNILVLDGEVHNLSPSQVYDLNSAYKYNLDYEPDYNLAVGTERYVADTATADAKYDKFNMSAIEEYSTPIRQRTTGGRQYQISSMPSAYRAPRRVRHSFEYRDVYGLNNIANNRLRYAMSHTHYRSANKYRAEAVRNLFRY